MSTRKQPPTKLQQILKENVEALMPYHRDTAGTLQLLRRKAGIRTITDCNTVRRPARGES